MRRHVLKVLGLGAVLAVALSAGDEQLASAQAFPAAWITVTRGGVAIIDNQAGTQSLDVVGDAANPALGIASDATHLFMRMRLNDSPGTAGAFNNDGWGCMIETNNVASTYEFLAIVDGNREFVLYRQNSTVGTDSTDNNAETEIATFATATFARRTNATSTFGGNADYFIEFAVPWATIRGGATAVAAGTPMRFICGTTGDSNSSQRLNNDVANNTTATPAALSQTWSDFYVCNFGGNPSCVADNDPDLDDVPNSVETLRGTNQNQADSDGDTIRDDVELRGATTAFTGPNTDTNGPIDALDTDSDNDCTPDNVDLANWRNTALPVTSPCTALTPICNTTSGACSACNGNNGSGTSLACPSAGQPACNTTGALTGSCTECKAGLLGLCGSNTPACSTATGTCVACNGNNGAATTAACPTAGSPLCNVGGALAGRCTQCNAADSSRCTGATPTCDLATGVCGGCTADNVAPCTAALPACNTTGPLIGLCTQCKPTLATQCLGATPACESTTGTCAICNGDNGAVATAACPSATSPACHFAGAQIGRCRMCSASNTTQCTAALPACDTASGACGACDGDRGSGSARACPDVANPYCFFTGGTAGQCGKCAVAGDCGGLHTGPTCEPVSGACIDVDTDGDGLQDAVENLLGTSPTKKDSDDDGIPDNVEVTPQGGGASTKVDTDNDTIIDAMDPDSDNDGVLDKDEATAADGGTMLDSDNDGIPNYRDDDDDNDLVKTKDEIADTAAAKVPDDVDGDGKKNWLDSDSNENGALDGFDGRGDDDGDTIPNYLDKVKDPPKPDAGPVVDAGPSSSSGSTSSSGVVETPDGGSSSGSDASDFGVIEGTGLFCSTSRGVASPIVIFGLGAAAAAMFARRRRKKN